MKKKTIFTSWSLHSIAWNLSHDMIHRKWRTKIIIDPPCERHPHLNYSKISRTVFLWRYCFTLSIRWSSSRFPQDTTKKYYDECQEFVVVVQTFLIFPSWYHVLSHFDITIACNHDFLSIQSRAGGKKKKKNQSRHFLISKWMISFQNSYRSSST